VAPYAAAWARWTLGLSFLSSVMDRLGWWGPHGKGNVSWGDLAHFYPQVAAMNPFLPAPLVPPVAWVETIIEGGLGLLLVVGLRTRVAARASGALLALFAVEMIFAYGLKSTLDFSVWSASAAAFLLMLYPDSAFSLDKRLAATVAPPRSL
jgi:uncharacterized membrane protein YphA (DoxX/SURF4 family)